MILIYIDIVILLVLLYINYRKYKFSKEFNIKQNLGIATLFAIIVLFGISIPAFSGILVKYSFLKPDSSEAYHKYQKSRLPLYWLLGALQILFLVMINRKIIQKKPNRQ